MILSDKPSEALRQAMVDLEAIEKDPRYQVNMVVWHGGNIEDHEVCHVCLAGAVMAKSGNVPFNEIASPYYFEYVNEQKFVAIDLFRRGLLLRGLNQWGVHQFSCCVPFIDVRPYESNPVGFKKDMDVVISTLERLGY